MTQDMNHTFVKVLRTVFVAAMMSLMGSHALAQVTVYGNVYGGGNLAPVGGDVVVNMKAGTVEKDVYGGGALADTNVNNATDYDGSGTEANSFTYSTTVNLTGGKIYGDAYGGGLGQMGTAVEGVHWTQEEIDAATDASNPAYGKTTSDWKVEPVAAGADGAGAVKAKVYGNVNVNLGSSASGSSATAFWITNYSGDHSGVVKSGRVFGCNNLNGSPLGNVTVTVYKTVEGNSSRSETADKNSTNATYELAAVYGGGNLANYTASGKKTHVIINGCSDTSVEYVYGGGNAAAVPEASVDINAAYEIGYVFGGGNGKDQYTLDDGTSWNTNPGANVNGNTTTMLYGGTIHEAFGGSNEKGTIFGTVSINTSTNADCALRLGKLYGAGKNADIEGDLIVTLGCMPGDENPTDEVYGGAENANVKGNVELTITSGTFHKVFGGNNTSGAIFGHIKLNIEETGCCPIKIDELYLGGYNAPYSVYGYYQEGTIPGTDKPNYVAIQSASDNTHTAVYFTSNDHTRAPYADPELNIISCTRIGKVFGGGLGSGAVIYGNPTVNINMIQGNHYNDNTYGVPAKMTELDLPSADNPNNLGLIGDVYGGGNAADVVGDPTVNIGTETTVTLTSIEDDPNTTEVNESQKTVLGAFIIGNVFGGGMGDDDNFFCDKAMIGKDGDGVDNPNGGPTVNIYKGTVRGNVYGGGEIGRVEKNTVVTIGTGDGTANGTPSPVILGSVFGGGKGKETHGYAALVRGNPTVTIQGNASVGHSVYGGGEIASVARYNVPKTEAEVEAAHDAGYTDAVLGMPYALADPDHPSGNCTVIVQGYAKIGPDGMQMTKTGGPDDTGYVFGAGKGILPGGVYEYVNGTTRRMVFYDEDVHTTVGQEGSKWQWVDPAHSDTNKNVWEYFENLDEYIKFIQTLALSSYTDVTIDGNALVKGSVYGGSENGIVQYDTDVKIQGGQVGVAASGSAECASWTYEPPYAPYDPYAKYYNSEDHKYYYDSDHNQEAAGGAFVATDGHTYYGNVFGGGSGSVPYFDNTLGRSVYLHSAGQVKGDTHVTISGGHILTNVYGGCEATNVNGTAYVTMTDGIIGVERTDDQIIAHPLTGYIFGAGKGDQRIFFNKDTNVKDAIVTVEGGRIYGSVYGGGEDGHVLRHVTVTIGKTGTTAGPTIGTQGTSYYDGHVFGGGRGFGGDALTAGNVGGSVELNIEGGSILGSVYGGGRLASVGYGLYLVDEEVTIGGNTVKPYGVLRPDNQYDNPADPPSTTETAAEYFGSKGRGHINITINGGTIGNDVEYVYNPTAVQKAGVLKNTQFDAETNRLLHTRGGNVFAGSMGSLYKQDGSTVNALWPKLAHAKQTTVTINNGEIKSSVYGGGELGKVDGSSLATSQSATNVIITGGTIGTEIKNGETVEYTYGSVFGGGYGSTVEEVTDENGVTTNPKLDAGIITGNTSIDMSGDNSRVWASVYGGGEVASVNGSTDVIINGGKVGKEKVGDKQFGGATMGNVYGGGSGYREIVRAGHIWGNAKVTIGGGTIYHNVYGGGAYGTVGDFSYNYKTSDDPDDPFYNIPKVNGVASLQTEGSGLAEVTITGGTIGVDGIENGMVFGSSRGDVGLEFDDWLAWVYDTHVIIGTSATGTEGEDGYVAESGPDIKGSVYGSGENGHVFNDTEVKIHGGTIGIHDGSAADAKRGNVYGGGCGEDKYDSDNNSSLDMYNPLAGIVYGNTKVTMDGGTVLHNIYGAGALGSVGKTNANYAITSGGKTTIDITGGILGYDGDDNGNVYGAARGDVNSTQTGISQVQETEVNIKPNTIEGKPDVKGSVFGGGQAGIVRGSVKVEMTGGNVGHDVYGGGALADTQTSNWDATNNTWATGMVDANGKTTYKTNVNLLGGFINGDAYGGGLGQKDDFNGKSGDIAAQVYGDVNVNLGSESGSSATAFNTSHYADANSTADYDESTVIKSGRVFGCNNLNGSPKGNVTVRVWRTVEGKLDGVTNPRTPKDDDTGCADKTSETHSYDVAAVYGGGNLANYEATGTGKKAHVVIETCEVSIETVYGGGNAAEVPGTDVLVKGAYEINEVFGGGNGSDPYTTDGGTTWVDNPGANIGNALQGGNASTLMTGGLIHAAYGGSNKKGTIFGSVSIDIGVGDEDHCDLDLEKMVGAGKDADVNGDLIMVLGCKPNTKIPVVYGGADNAHVNGDIELTITSGIYEEVYGGNNAGGYVFGHIKLNIEERDCTTPIKIDHLYLGGKQAAYSMYGYYNAGTEDAPDPQPRTAAMADPTDANHYKATLTKINGVDVRRQPDATTHSYAQPELNIISCTYIGEVYGGGYGSNATLYGDPIVNINMVPGPKAADNIDRDGNGTADGLAHALGKIGDVYGGGNQAAVEGSTTVNIGTAKKVEMTSLPKVRAVEGDPEYDANLTADEQPMVYQKETVEGAYITGDVYGGGNEANVTGNTYVNVCAYKDYNTTADVIYKGVTISGTDFEGVRIKGNVFGGGKGVTEDAGVTGAFLCAKAMVGEVNTNDGSTDIMNESTDKGTRVSIGNGTVEGSVYGGGEVGRVEWNGVVTIGLPVGTGETSAPVIQQNVFGGGKGVEQYGYSALLRGNTFVTVQANAKVGRSVYGGGEIASVGKYNIVKQTDIDNPTFMEAHPGIEKGMPYSLGNEGSGYCNVIVRGNAEIGPDNMKMYYADGTPPDDEGHVFGAGKGVLPYENEDDFKCQASDHNKAKHPGRMGPDDAWECYYGQEAKYLKFIETQALATHTEVLVDGNAFVKGSVYGGSLSGHVQHDTHVTIAGDCQIGAGFDELTGKSLAKYTNWPTNTQDITTSWAECAHWTYDAADNSSYDPYAKYKKTVDGKERYYYDEGCTDANDANGGSYIAKDGHTYYGNVFGGGSGIVPYRPGEWHREAGTVGGNTRVDITGGHILTSVYGGNEHTDVGTYDNTSNRALLAGTGKCIINMTGGTVGVPRTKEDIAAHPVTCYVFGAGKGDARVTFNKWTNVGETEVNITGSARIYGSTFGGGEDGHVLGNVVTNIGGSVDLNGDGDKTDAGETFTDPSLIIGTHGLSGADGNIFGGGRGFSEEALTAGVVCGNVTVNIYKGTMLGSVFGGGRLASVGTHLDSEDGQYYGKLIPDGKNQVIGGVDVEASGVAHGHININISGGTIGATDDQGKLLTSTSSIGDVFGGCKGSGNNKKFGLAKKTTITMTGGTVNGNVYGGGELGYVGEAELNTTSNVYDWNEESVDGGLCTVGISGGTVAGNVFGAGKGKADDFDCEKALVRTTSVAISGTGTRVSGNVYGGGEIGRVDQNTEVTIGSGDGTEGGDAAPTISSNVFGAGAGVETHGYSALVRGNSTVTIQGNAHVGHSVYGGGMIASVGQYGLDSNFMPETLKAGGDCKVTVKGYAVIGASGEGHVFGAGMGVDPFDDNHSYIDYTTDSTDKETKPKRMTKTPAADKMPALYDNVGDGSMYIWEYYTSQDKYFNFLQTLALATDSYATVEGNATVNGSVYGGSESGFVQRETDVKIQGSSKIETTTDTNGKAINGNVFGGGRGVSGFDMAGRVRGNAKTTISGSSTVYGTVYGGGELGFVGKFEKGTDDYGTIYNWSTIKNQSNVDENTGLCTVEINSASAEIKGHVFGAGKGEAETFECEPAMTKTTSVTISAGKVGGNVYGGGEVGRVDKDTEVTIGDGTSDGAGSETGTDAPVIAGSVFGAGAGLETHGYSALVRGNATVTIQGNANVGQSVYGGGQIASVGRYALDKFQMPSLLVSGGICTVDVKGWSEIGTSTQGGNVFGACRGVDPDYNYGSDDKKDWSKRMMKYSDEFVSGKTVGTDWDYYENDRTYIWDYMTSESAYLSYLETLALATEPIVTISGNTNINGDVYGGGERGLTKGSVTVNIQGGTIMHDVYGGGALANTNISNWKKYGGETVDVSDDYWDWTDAVLKSAKYTTTVNLHVGTIGHNVYGGGLGEKPSSTNANGVAALVYGDVTVNLNETIASDNCVVKGVVHGANNYFGSPKGDVTVHVYKTTTIGNGWTEPKKDSHGDIVYESDGETPVLVTHKKTERVNLHNENEALHFYDLKAVYGGGNEATYDPIESTNIAHVIIDGCDLTSIETVYGGGNAASAPGTHVLVNSCYEIGTVFGGGNGKDDLDDGSENPGADVGYKPNDGGTDKVSYGTGIASAELQGGTIHKAFGGSNTKGNVRTSATVTLDEVDPVGCPLCIEEVYGAGNEADQDGSSNINLGCISYLSEIYGGAKNADINNNIDLTIQSGRFNRVFGGNNLGGSISGTITVNIEETGCHPIVIGQLFGGGNQAAYTAPWKDKNNHSMGRKDGPTVNVKSFTSIGEIYGGGYGGSAIVTGDTYVNINECKGKYADRTATEDFTDEDGNAVIENDVRVKVSENTGKWIHFVAGKNQDNSDKISTVWQPEHRQGAIGTIGNVFGGGNEAGVVGNTNINIGNKEYVDITTNIVVGETDVRDYYIRSGEGTQQSPYEYTEVDGNTSVTAEDGTTYYQFNNDTETYTEIDGIEVGTDVSNYYIRSGEGNQQSPYVYSKVPITAQAGTTYYKKVLGVNITGNVYGGGNAADVSGDTNVFIGE